MRWGTTREREPEEEGIGAGLRPRLLGVARRPRGREAGREEVAASARAVPTFASAYWQRLRTTGKSPGGLGLQQCWANWVPGKLQVRFCLFLFWFLFPIYVILF